MEHNHIEAFRDVASDSEAWRHKARILRRSAESLWDSYRHQLAGNPPDNREQQLAIVQNWLEHMHTAQFLYGLAVETALKAKMIPTVSSSNKIGMARARSWMFGSARLGSTSGETDMISRNWQRRLE